MVEIVSVNSYIAIFISCSLYYKRIIQIIFKFENYLASFFISSPFSLFLFLKFQITSYKDEKENQDKEDD